MNGKRVYTYRWLEDFQLIALGRFSEEQHVSEEDTVHIRFTVSLAKFKRAFHEHITQRTTTARHRGGDIQRHV